MPRKNLIGGQAGGSAFSLLRSTPSGSSSRVYTGTQAEKIKQAREDDLPPLERNSRQEATRELVRLLTTANPKAQAAGQKAAAEGGFDAKTAAALGQLIPLEHDGIKEKALKTLGPLAKVVEVIGRPQQATMELIQAASHDTGLDKLYGPDEDIAHLVKTGNESTVRHNGGPSAAEIIGDAAGSGGYRDAWRALKGEKRWDPISQSYTHDLQYAAALGANPDALGKVGNTASFIGGAALDPLNFVGLGEAKTATKVGREGAALLADDAARELTPALARQLERQGVEAGAEKIAPEALQQALKRTGIRAGTTKAQRAAIREALIAEAESGVGRTTKGVVSEGVKTAELKGDRLIRRGVRAITGKGERTGAERVAEDAIDSAMRYDRGGLRVAGRSILPEGVRAPVRGLIKDDIRQIGGTRAAQAVLADAAAQADKLDAKAAKLTAKSDELLTQADDLAVSGNPEDAVKMTTTARGLQTRAKTALAASADIRGEAETIAPEPVTAAAAKRRLEIGRRQLVVTKGMQGGADPRFADIPNGYVRYFRGDKVGATGLPGELSSSGMWFTPDPNYASTYGDSISYVDVPDTLGEASHARVQGFNRGLSIDGQAQEVLLPPDVVAQARPLTGQATAHPVSSSVSPSDHLIQSIALERSNTSARNKAIEAVRNPSTSGGQDVDALLAKMPWLGNVQTPVTETVARRLLPNFRPLEGKMDTLRRSFIPRSAIDKSRSLVPGTADKVYESQILAAGSTKAAAEQGRRIMNKAAEVVDKVSPETQREVLKAMDIGGSLDELLPKLDDAGKQYATNLDKLRKYTYDLNIKEKLANVLKFRKRDDYMARYVTEEASKALDELQKLDPAAYDTVREFHSGKAVTSQGGHKLARTVMPDTPLLELNEIISKPLREHGLIAPEANALELDPLKIIARRFDQTIPDLQFVRSVKEMEKGVKGTLGEDLVVRVDPGVEISEKDFTRRGLQEIPLDNAVSGRLFAHPDIAPEISNLMRKTVSNDEIGAFGKTMDQWNRLWKSYATVPIITGTGFHSKNTIGNMFNNHLASVATYAYKDAFEDQKAIWQAKRAHPDLSVPDALAANGVDADRIAKIELAFENQILDEGFFNTDLHGHAKNAIEGKRGKGQRLAAKFDPRNPEQMWGVPTGRKIGEHIEDNARLAHFYSKLDETGNAAQAAASVRKYLFDYGDLTPFERKIMKRIHAFYTFTRKNTPLQFEELVRNPAAVNRLAMAEQAVLGGDGGSAGKDVPSFMGDIGGPVGRPQAGLLTGNKNGVVGNIDTPLDAASKTVDPLLFLAGKRSAMDTAQGVLGNVSGGPATAVKTAFEEATGRSAFTGGSLVDLEGKRRKNPLLSATDMFIPAISKGTRTLPALKNLATGDPGGETADSNRLIVIKALTGLSAKEVTPEMQKLARNEKLRSLRDIIDALKKSGVDVPTIEEFQTIGELNKTPRRKRAG